MRQGSNGRRPRGRANRKQHVPLRAQVFDSNGPEGRVRGNAHQVYERYLALARDASSSGDRIQAESFFQFAEHYLRILNAANASNAGAQNANAGQGGRPVDPGSAEQPSVRSDERSGRSDTGGHGQSGRPAHGDGAAEKTGAEARAHDGDSQASTGAEPAKGNGESGSPEAAESGAPAVRTRRQSTRTRRPRSGNGDDGAQAGATGESSADEASEQSAHDTKGESSISA
jgi:hypothetical protein